jgi:hypothetical protein
MRSRRIIIAAGLSCASILLVSVGRSEDADREARARDYIRFLVTELAQWTSDMPQVYDAALVRPPVDSSRLSEVQKAAADNVRDSVKQLNSLAAAADVTTNAGFRAQLEKVLEAAKPMNEALSVQRFPAALENDWAPIRTNLNSLAGIYHLEELAALERPAPGSGRGGGATAVPAGAITGYIVDQRCAGSGKAMWTNAQCVARCVRDGDKVVLVTEAGKVYQIANQNKIDQDSYGQKVAVSGKTEGDEITVSAIQNL